MSQLRNESPSEPLAQRLRDLEELYMHLERTVHDLDQIVVEQGKQLAALNRELGGINSLLRSMAEAQGGPPSDPLDEKPPHY